MARIWHPYTAWEEVPAGMWRTVGGPARRRFLEQAIEFTGDHERYGAAMLLVLDTWVVSCEHNLTDIGQNRLAWIGHAACCLAIGVPEDVTREAWGHLNEAQRLAANRKAMQAVITWENKRSDQLALVMA